MSWSQWSYALAFLPCFAYMPGVSRIAIPVCAEAERARGAARTDEATDVPERLHACTLPLRAAGGCSC